MVVRFAKHGVEDAERLDRWQDAVGAEFLTLRVSPAVLAGFDGALERRRAADLELIRVVAKELTAVRTRRHVERSPVDDYLLAIHLRGVARASQAGRDVVLQPGDFALFDSARPYRIDFGGSRLIDHLVIRIPRQKLQARCPDVDDALVLQMGTEAVTGRVLNPLLRELWGSPTSVSLVDPALDLLASCLEEAAQASRPLVPASGHALARLVEYTRAHSDDPTLSPRGVAYANGMSVRHMHRLFAFGDSTFGTVLREVRLERAHRRLTDRRYAPMPVSAIAERSGFRSAAHFSRAFRARYGVSPSRARAARAPGSQPAR